MGQRGDHREPPDARSSRTGRLVRFAGDGGQPAKRKEGGMERNTRQRTAIRAAFEHARRPLGPAEVLAAAQREVGRLGIATVYRNIRALVAEGWLVPVELPGESDRYEPAGLEHHHHFRCRSCDRVFDLSGCVKGLRDLVPRRFRLEGHELVLLGQCGDCVRAA
jgi:Fur family ferric uptake transcriptional regulator